MKAPPSERERERELGQGTGSRPQEPLLRGRRVERGEWILGEPLPGPGGWSTATRPGRHGGSCSGCPRARRASPAR